jgi:PAS domain S-box-containing protein
MLKQSDAIIIFVILAAVIAVLVMASNTGSLVVIGVLAAVFGGLIGTRLRKSQSAEPENEAADASSEKNEVEPQSAPASQPVQSEAAVAPRPSEYQSANAMSGPVTNTAIRPKAAGESAAPSQVEMLKNLVSSVSEGITFKDPNGRYISANAAFAQMLGSRPSEIVGRDDAGVFGHLTAKSLLESDDAAAEQGNISTTLEVPLPHGSRYFEITKASVNNDNDDSLEGIVAVWRDVTEPALDRLRREKAMRETITAFTRSIALSDTYLVDHAQRLARLAMAVTDEMELGSEARTTVELSAYLSQIGKLGIDSELLSQQRRFTEQEIKEMERHVHNTARLLRNLDFGLPVASALFQMNERLDGTGYPQGLDGPEIALPARILGACDVFCARIAPRSYRPAITTEAAMDILLQNSHRYDETVVQAMQRVVTSPESAEILASR